MKMKAYFFRTLFSQYGEFFSLALPSLLFPFRVVTTFTNTDSKPYRTEVTAGRAQGSLIHVPEAQVRVATESCGSVSFRYPCHHWIMNPDSGTDSALFFSGFQDANRQRWGTVTIFYGSGSDF
jgi:hypothetical protein